MDPGHADRDPATGRFRPASSCFQLRRSKPPPSPTCIWDRDVARQNRCLRRSRPVAANSVRRVDPPPRCRSGHVFRWILDSPTSPRSLKGDDHHDFRHDGPSGRHAVRTVHGHLGQGSALTFVRSFRDPGRHRDEPLDPGDAQGWQDIRSRWLRPGRRKDAPDIGRCPAATLKMACNACPE